MFQCEYLAETISTVHIRIISLILSFSSLFSCLATTLLFWFTTLMVLFLATAVFSEKALKTHCTLPAQQQTAAFSSLRARCFPQELVEIKSRAKSE